MEKAGIIEKATCSPWAANLVIASKANGDPRITVDHRGLNACCIRDKFPLPRISDCFDALAGGTFYSVLDLSSSYHQLRLDPRNRHKTAFVTRLGSWQYCCAPMGYVNSGANFSRLMALTLSGLTWKICLSFLDDVICYSDSFEGMCQNLQTVLNRFRESNLKLKPTKCRLFQRKIEFLGR
jgi:putative transposase